MMHENTISLQKKKKKKNSQALVFKCTEDKNNMTPQKTKKKTSLPIRACIMNKNFFPEIFLFSQLWFTFYNTQGVKSKHKSFYSRTFLEDDTVQTKSLCITGFYHRYYLWNFQKQSPSYNRYT